MSLSKSTNQVPAVRRITSLGFVVVHAAAAMLAVYTLSRSEFYDGLLRFGIQTSSWHPILSFWALPVGVVLFLLVGGWALWELQKAIRIWHRGEQEPDAFLRARVLAYVALMCIFVNAFIFSTPEKLSGPYRLRIPILGIVTAVIAYGAYVLWYVMLPRLRRLVPDRRRRGLDLIAMNVALTLVLAEGALRVTANFVPVPLLVTESMPSQVRRSANRQIPGTSWFGFPINSSGHYDTEISSRSDVPGKLVVSIGDSFSYGVVPHDYHFTTVAEGELPGVEIYNMGFSGIGPTDYRYLLETEALPLQPDLIVIQLYVGNDLTEGPALAGPPRWYDGDSYLTAIVWHRLRIMQQAKLTHADNAARATEESGGALAAYPFLTNPLVESPSLAAEAYYLLETTQAESICLPQAELYERFFDSIVEIVRTAGTVPLKFVLIPDEFQVEDDVWEEVLRRSGKPLDRDLPQHMIVEWFEARGLDVLDLLPFLRSVEPMQDGQRHVFHARNLHFNARGNAIAGQSLANLIEGKPAESEGQVAKRALAKLVEGKLAQLDSMATGAQAVPTVEAVAIMRSYTDLLRTAGVNGSVVVDSSVLDVPKDRILDAVVSLSLVTTNQAEKRSFGEVAKSLAFFQPDVGDTPTPLDETRPDGATWRNVVVQEMQSIHMTLTAPNAR